MEYGAKPNLDTPSVINIAISNWNFPIFNLLIENGATINEVDVDVGNFPITISTALSNHQFVARLCKLGLDVSQLFSCPYGEDQHRDIIQRSCSFS